jgi:hypothetical protein
MASSNRPPADYSNRAIGIVALPAFGFLFWACTYTPIMDALNEAGTVDYSGKGLVVQPFLLFVGLIYAIFGESAAKFMGPTSRPSIVGWSVFIGCGIMGLLQAHFVKAFLISHGYIIV